MACARSSVGPRLRLRIESRQFDPHPGQCFSFVHISIFLHRTPTLSLLVTQPDAITFSLIPQPWSELLGGRNGVRVCRS